MGNDINNSIELALLGKLNVELILVIIPELVDTIGCQQNHPGHSFDVFAHTIKVVEQLPLDLTLRLAGLLHDIGKPEKKVLGSDGYDHFWGHEEVSAQKAKLILERLNINKSQANTIIELIRLHDTPIAKNISEMRIAIEKYGRKFISDLLVIQQADLYAHSKSYCDTKLPQWEKINKLYKAALDNSE